MEIFRLFGIHVRIQPSWVLLVALVAWSLAVGVFPQQAPELSRTSHWLMALAGTLGLFASLLAHELSHSLVGRRHGMRFEGIRLFILGGVAESEAEPASPRAEISLAAVGPAVSALLGALLYGLFYVGIRLGLPPTITLVVGYLGDMNFLVAAFNLLPAFPLDGGRILRGSLWAWKKDLVGATRSATALGVWLAWILVGLGALFVFQGAVVAGIWWAFIGLFLRRAARVSLEQVVLAKSLEGKTVADVMTPSPAAVTRALTLRDLVDDYVFPSLAREIPVVEDGRWIGFVRTDDVALFPEEDWLHRRVGEIFHPLSEAAVLHPEEGAWSALGRGRDLQWVARGDKLVGVLDSGDLVERVNRRRELTGDRLAA